jgi:CheY-like chemotaxis protein
LSSPTLSATLPGMDRQVVLIADADPAACRSYRTALQTGGFDTDDAFDGRDALAKTFALRPSAVVIAPDLAFIDGYELCRLLRGDGRTAAIRLVMVTDTVEEGDRARAWGAGADAVVDRPTAVQSLDDAVRRVMTGAHPEQPLPPASKAPSGARRTLQVRAHERFVTRQPPLAPPSLRCPSCDTFLVYDRSHVGGVSARHREQWDYFVCATCGGFEFRQRTRKLRRIVQV